MVECRSLDSLRSLGMTAPPCRSSSRATVEGSALDVIPSEVHVSAPAVIPSEVEGSAPDSRATVATEAMRRLGHDEEPPRTGSARRNAYRDRIPLRRGARAQPPPRRGARRCRSSGRSTSSRRGGRRHACRLIRPAVRRPSGARARRARDAVPIRAPAAERPSGGSGGGRLPVTRDRVSRERAVVDMLMAPVRYLNCRAGG